MEFQITEAPLISSILHSLQFQHYFRLYHLKVIFLLELRYNTPKIGVEMRIFFLDVIYSNIIKVLCILENVYLCNGSNMYIIRANEIKTGRMSILRN